MTVQSHDAPVFLTVTQTARRENVSVPTIWRWAREGKFPPPVKLGDNCTRFRLADLQAWEAEAGRAAS